MRNRSLEIYNARIWTGDATRPWANSIVMREGRIAALDVKYPESERIDAEGRTITPGLIDAHMHLLRGAKSLADLDLSSVKSREQFETLIAQRHAELPAHEWLIGHGWSQENWRAGGGGRGGELPDSSWLKAAADRPCVCYRMDMHVAVVNEPVLRMCDVSHEPAGGRIDREPVTGKPTGIMVEAALWKLVNPLIPKQDSGAQQSQLLAARRHLHRLGITGVGTMEYARDVREVFEPLRDHLKLRCRITLLDRAWPMDFSFARDFENDDHLAVIGYKAFIDGTLGSRTARMLADYADDPGHRGMLLELAADGHLNEWAVAVARQGLSPSMHAIGDEAVRMALDAIDAVESRKVERRNLKCQLLAPDDFSTFRLLSPRIEHAQHIDASDIHRFAGRIASMQPLHKADDCRYVRRRLGEGRVGGAFAFRRLKDAGAILAFGSDWPVVSCDPMLGIRAAVTGLTLDGEPFGVDQNLTVEESLRAYTVDAAGALGMKESGVIQEGARADLVMFDRDPFTANWVDAAPKVVMAVVEGKVAYDGRFDAASVTSKRMDSMINEQD